jgi:hypothetical protein
MALESVDHIDDLNAANPLGTDPRSRGDDHIRNIKKALKADFPNIDAAVTPTPAELNVLDGVTGGTVLASSAVVVDASKKVNEWLVDNITIDGNGTANQLLQTDGSGQLSWGSPVTTAALTTQGDILFRNASALARLGAGTSGQVLTSGGAGADVTWGSGFDASSPGAIGDSTPSTGDFTVLTASTEFDLPSGNTAGRPATPNSGSSYLNTTLGYAEYYFGGGWVPYSAVSTPEVEYLVIAGGGGGGVESGGGGGAGGFKTATGLAVASGSALTVTVGAGGAGATSNSSKGSNGSDSVFSSITATGGGGGASSGSPVGAVGGSGGGGANDGGINAGGAGTGSEGSAGGSDGVITSPYPGGGGGGQSAVGGNGSTGVGGTGGAGLASSISGSSVNYAGGGGGGIRAGGTVGGASFGGSAGTISGTPSADGHRATQGPYRRKV